MSVACDGRAVWKRCLWRREVYLPRGTCFSTFTLAPQSRLMRELPFPYGRRTRFQTKCGVLIIQIFLLRATLVTPPPLRGTHDSVVQGTALPSLSTARHLVDPLKASFAINRGGFCKALTISIVGISLISNSRYIIKMLIYLPVSADRW